MSNQGDSNEKKDKGNDDSSWTVDEDKEQETQLGVYESEEATNRIRPNIKEFLKRLSLTDWIMAVATVVIAGATIWNVVVVAGQLHEMQSSG